MIANLLRSIMGPQYFSQVLDINQILSQFNGEDDMTNLITFLDECTFSGDKKQSAQIKGFISELRKKHEAKFVNRIEVDNRTNIMISSNTDTCVQRSLTIDDIFVLRSKVRIPVSRILVQNSISIELLL